ncbi:MAG: hypothetical protein ACHP84_20450 [Caulobacterales bacterium]
MRLALLLLAAVLLTGCNQVISQKPMFTAADQAALTLRPGLWRMDNPDCRVDERMPATLWPTCAVSLGVRGSEIVTIAGGKADPDLNHTPWILAAGDPMILQLGRREPPHSSGKPSEPASYAYFGVTVAATDRQGRIIALRGWPVACGPRTTAAAPDAPPLYPGLHAIDHDCTTDDVAALRNAASATLAQGPEIQPAHWVRDGYR